MTRSRLIFVACSMLVVLFLVSGSLLGAVARDRDDQGSFYKYLSVFTEVLDLVRRFYVDEADPHLLVAGALDATADALDPFSLYVPAAEVERYLAARQIGPRRSGLRLLKERGMTYAASVWPGCPAATAGIEVGDLVAELQGRSTRLMPLWEAEAVLAAADGTRVEVKVMRRGEPVAIGFALASCAPPGATLEETRGVPVLHVGSLEPGSAARIEALVEPLAARRERRLVLDLRGVTAGDPAEAYAVADLFAAGDLGSLRDREGLVTAFAGRPEVLWQGDIVALMDRSTLGAAEIVATVLRQTAGARLVGERSFGYAGRLGLVELSSGGRMQLTDAFYAGPDGEPIDDSLVPDLLVDESTRAFGEREAPLRELILQRGLRLILGEEQLPAKKVAA